MPHSAQRGIQKPGAVDQGGAQSTVGLGCIFWFTARLHRDVQPDAAHTFKAGSPEATLARDHAGARVLVVDDEPVNREVANAILQGVFGKVDVADDGNEAVRMAGQNAHELILMDLQMPDIGGLEATRQIRLLPGGMGSVIVALTANGSACRHHSLGPMGWVVRRKRASSRQAAQTQIAKKALAETDHLILDANLMVSPATMKAP